MTMGELSERRSIGVLRERRDVDNCQHLCFLRQCAENAGLPGGAPADVNNAERADRQLQGLLAIPSVVRKGRVSACHVSAPFQSSALPRSVPKTRHLRQIGQPPFDRSCSCRGKWPARLGASRFRSWCRLTAVNAPCSFQKRRAPS